MTIVFINQIAKIKVFKNAIDFFYSVEERIVWKGWFKFKKEEVIVSIHGFTKVIYAIDTFSDDYRYYDAENKKVKYKPHLELYLSDGSCELYYFSNEIQLDARLQDIKRQNPHIIIN